MKVIAQAILMMLCTHYSFAQDIDINLNPQQAFILDKTKGSLEVKICNCHTASIAAPGDKPRPQISFPDNLVIKGITNSDGSALTGFTIQSSGNDPGNHSVLLLANAALPNASCTSFLVQVEGNGIGTGVITATLGSQGPQTEGNHTTNDNAIAAIPVQVNFPVTLREFRARKEEGIAILNWITTEEMNASHFDVQRSENGKSWQTLASVPAKGNSKIQTDYSFTDTEPLTGQNLYRLHMIDIDGSATYSNICNLKFDFQPQFVFPNPAKDFLRIKVEDWSQIQYITVRDTKGRQIFHSAGKPTDLIDLTGFTEGIYIVEVVKTNSETKISRIVVAR